MLSIGLSLTGQLRSSVSPAALFLSGEPGVWYDPSDLTTMFQDTAGTTPVTTPGQTVALLLDKSKGLVLGSELITPVANQDFSSDTGYWNKGSGVTISGGKVNFSASSGYVLYRGSISGIAVGGYYEFTFTVSDYVSGSIRPYLGSTASFGTSVSANGTYTVRLAPTAGGEAGFNSASAFTGSIDNVSIKAITGNHATQATTASRPTYGIVPLGGRRNLLTYSEDLSNAVWVIDASSVTKTAARIEETATTGFHYVRQQVPSTLSGNFSFGCDVKTDGRRYAWLYAATSAQAIVYFDLQLGTVASTVGSGVSGSITSVGDGYYRITLFANIASPISNVGIGLTDTDGIISYAGDVTKGLFVRNAQLEAGSTATAYQRVTTQYDVTEAGVQSLSYLSFDGVDDGMVTGTITPGIDKVQVFAGVRKLGDAAAQAIVELSTSITILPGSFYLLGPRSTSPTYDFTSRGSVAGGTAFISGYTAPITNILTGLGDISGDRQTLRVNGTQVAQDTADQGTGNFLAYPLYIGRRAGTSLPFNGQIYGMIVRFGANLDAGTITSTETFVAGKTGVTL
jgi:hypothetical protein